jgi:hypothetical protein
VHGDEVCVRQQVLLRARVEQRVLVDDRGSGGVGSLIVTTNLPFGDWTKVFPDPRLAKAVVDRITHKAHIIDHEGNAGVHYRSVLVREVSRREVELYRDPRRGGSSRRELWGEGRAGSV